MTNTLPPQFIERLAAITPESILPAVLTTFSAERPVCFRTNTLKSTTAELLKRLANLSLDIATIDALTNAFTIPTVAREQLTHSQAFNDGLCYIQNPSSMLPPLLLQPQPGEEVLDLCAAPGSKTTQLACLMQNQGRIAAVEKSKIRFFKLKANVEQQGASCVALYHKDGSLIWRHCENRFDKVLVDAPCSSEARFQCNDPKSIAHWNLNKIKEMTRKQWPLLYSGYRCLKPGGTLIYSTCSFAPEENEAIINKLLKRTKGAAKIETITMPIKNWMPGLTTWQNSTFDASLANTIRVLPNEIFEGFFICKIRKHF